MPAHSFQLIDYTRFAELTPSQKAAARKLWNKTNDSVKSYYAQIPSADQTVQPTPLIHCWFLPEGDGVSDHAFFERDPLGQ